MKKLILKRAKKYKKKMKIKKIKIKKKKLLKFFLAQNLVYINNFKISNFDNFLNIRLEQIELYFKSALKIIYEYHNNNRRILFIGFSELHSLFLFDLLKTTKHYYIPEKAWINGIINNNRAILRFLYKKILKISVRNKKILFSKNIKVLFDIKTKPDLIVIFNPNFDADLIKEFFNLDIPVIKFGSNVQYDMRVLYKIPGSFQSIKSTQMNLSNFLLYAVLKKSLKKQNKIF